MLKITVDNKISPALSRFGDKLEEALSRAANESVDIVIKKSVTRFMRDARGEPARRSPLDGGPLRIVSGRLSRSLTGLLKRGSKTFFGNQEAVSTGGAESVYRLVSRRGYVNVAFGSNTPYAAIHEFGGQAGRGLFVTIPGRPFLGPSMTEERTSIINRFDAAIEGLAREVGL